ncbi:hypothetical protein R2R35_11910 [Anaerocolumna sp. AGMB13020]|uniref:hypothetical protein n=1 Tax=Anaerocolumna sp. AGMB13020 TaxID=3081750 RepID=UPI00295552A3|nr:hypothetical protein [Anaerocolumna sp. AGMB13020]WOO34520.1 hypothetical protein R2R35_11910 [Anaerocolumna sp. AGMB13020]
MFKTLAIYDKDGEYASHLSEYIKSKARGIFQIRLFTEEDALKEYLKNEAADILLWGEEAEEIDLSINNYSCLVILTQAPDSIIPPGCCTAIYKYQPGERILNGLKELLPEESGELRKREGKKELITVFSLNNAHFSRGFSLDLWKEKARLKNTLFFMLEPFNGVKGLEIRENESGLSEFIYYLKQNTQSMNKKLINLIQKKGELHFMKGAAFGTDLYEITPEDMENWLQLIYQSEYDTVLFETVIFSPAIIKLLKASTKIYVSAEEGEYGEGQLNSFLSQLKWAGYEDVLTQISVVRIGKEYSFLGLEIENC